MKDTKPKRITRELATARRSVLEKAAGQLLHDARLAEIYASGIDPERAAELMEMIVQDLTRCLGRVRRAVPVAA